VRVSAIVSLAVLIGLAGFGLEARGAEPVSLAKKAAIFEHDMNKRFVFDGEVMCKLRLPQPDEPKVTYNMPDNAYMTGIYLGAMSMEYAVTHDSEAQHAAGEAIKALNLLCTVSGKTGLLARAAVPMDRPWHDDGEWHKTADGQYRWRGDVSNDQMTGVIYGFAMAYDLVADPAQKKMIAKDVGDLVGYVLDNDLRIIGFDGKPTQWGRYDAPYVKRVEHQNALLWLQHLKVAAHVTGEKRFADAYQKYAVDEGYAETAVKARRGGNPFKPGMVNHSDDVLLYLAYVPLLRLEKDGALKDKYLASLRRTWEGDGHFPGVKPEGNPHYAFLVHKYLGDSTEDAAGIQTLRWFPFDMKWNHDTLASYEEELGFKAPTTPQSPAPGPHSVIPIDRRPKTWSAWVQDPYVAGTRTADIPLAFNGNDYLMSYWTGRYWGYIGAKQ